MVEAGQRLSAWRGVWCPLGLPGVLLSILSSALALIPAKTAPPQSQ